MTDQARVLAIDFGTSNSYFCTCPSDDVDPSGIAFRNDKEGVSTAILYRDDKESLVGDEGLEQWWNATDEERNSYRLRTHFKPEIASHAEARQCAEDFLKVLLVQSERKHLNINPEGRTVIIGVPSASKTKRDFNNALCDVAKRAGYGHVETMDESVGAVLYHVWNAKDLSPGEAYKGILVVDLRYNRKLCFG